MKIAICDDDKQLTDDMVHIMQNINSSIDIQVFHQPHQLLAQELCYDVLFLDIDMPDMNGIEVGNHIRKQHKTLPIVYLTNMPNYRSMAFGVHAFDYIEKPITIEKVQHILDDLKAYKTESIVVPSVSFHSKEGILQLGVNEILYFEFQNRHVYLHTAVQTYTLLTNLYKIRDRMQNYAFATPHKSFCINLEHVRQVKGYDIFMSDQTIIPLSQKKSSEFRKDLHLYLSQCLHEGEK